MNFPLIAGRHKEVACRIERHGPDIFGLGVVEHFRFGVASDAIDLAIGRSGSVDAIAGINRNGMDLKRSELRDQLALTIRTTALQRDAVEFGARAAGVEVALRILRQRPEIGASAIESLA